MKERIKGAFTKRKILHFLKMALFVVALSLILLSLLGTVAHATGLVDDTINAENLYSKYPLSNYQLDFYVDNSWSWLPWNWLDGIGKSVQYGLYCITNFVWTISLYLKEKAKSSVSDFKRGMVQEQQSRQTGRLEKQEQHRQNIADKRMELQKAQEARQAQRKADGSATTGATRPHERPATASTIPKSSAEKTQEVKRPATATTSKASEPVKTTVIKERPLSSGASDRKATQPTQPVHRQNVEKVVSQETRQNYTKDRRTKVQQTQNVQRNQQTIEKTRNLVMKKGQKKK